MNDFVILNLGSAYIWFGIFCIGFCLWIAFGGYGKIKFGNEDEKPEYSTFSWAEMLLCCGVGAGVIYWSIIQWVYYYTASPLGAGIGTWQAAEISAAYLGWPLGLTQQGNQCFHKDGQCFTGLGGEVMRHF